MTQVVFLFSLLLALFSFSIFGFKKIEKDHEKAIKKIGEDYKATVKKIDEDFEQSLKNRIKNYKASIDELTKVAEGKIELLILDQKVPQDKLN